MAKKVKMDLWRIEKQITGDGLAMLLTEKDFMPVQLMYITPADLMDGKLQLDKLLKRYGMTGKHLLNMLSTSRILLVMRIWLIKQDILKHIILLNSWHQCLLITYRISKRLHSSLTNASAQAFKYWVLMLTKVNGIFLYLKIM